MTLVIKSRADDSASGKWVGYQDGVSFKLRGIDCGEYQIGIERARRLIAKSDSGQSLGDITVSEGDAQEFDVQCGLLGRYIVLDWKGDIANENGDATDYSPESAAQLLRGNPALFGWIISQAVKISTDAKKVRAETLGKPLPATDGKSSETD